MQVGPSSSKGRGEPKSDPPQINVLNVVHLLDAVTGGGTAERTVQLCRSLARSGTACAVLTMDIGITRELLDRLKGVDVFAAPSLSQRFPVPLMNPFKLVSLVRRASVVCFMNHWTALNVVVYWVCRILRKPYTVCPAGALQPFGRSPLLKKVYNWVVGRNLIRNARACVAITKSEIDDFLSYGVERHKIHIIPNGIDPEDFPEDISSVELKNFRDRHGLGEDPVILFMGRLNRIKGPDLLLDAFIAVSRAFPAYHLVFAGPDNGLLLSLKQSAEFAGLSSRVHFLGYVTGRDKAYAYRMADVLVIPSRQEAMSIVVLEAGVSGTPVLATDRCGLDDLAAEGAVKIVSPTSKALSEGLTAFLAYPVEARNVGARLKRSVFSGYLWATQSKQHLRLFREIQSLHHP